MEKKEVRLLRILNRFEFGDSLFTEEGLKESEEDADFRLLNERTFVIKAAICQIVMHQHERRLNCSVY